MRIGLLASLTMAALLMSPVVASAQEDTGSETFLSTTSTTTTSTAMVTALGVVTVVFITPKPENQVLRLYLEHNAVAVQDALHLGAGASLGDIAAAFGVRNEGHEFTAFAAVLVNEQERLSALLGDERVSDEELQAFILTVYEGMLAHDSLLEAARRLES